MDEARAQFWRVDRRYLDVIAEHVVVADLQIRDAGLAGIAALERGDQLAALVTERLELVELRRVARRDKAAVARQ